MCIFRQVKITNAYMIIPINQIVVGKSQPVYKTTVSQ